jgi:hypothetical protein
MQFSYRKIILRMRVSTEYDFINIPRMGFSLKNDTIVIKLMETLSAIARRVSFTSHHKIPSVNAAWDLEHILSGIHLI